MLLCLGWISLLSSRDEHTDWLWSGPRAKDPRGGAASLQEAKRSGQRHPYFGSSQGDKWGSDFEDVASSCVLFCFFKSHRLCPQDKAGPHKEIYPYVIQELRPTLDELGISTPEELGIDKL